MAPKTPFSLTSTILVLLISFFLFISPSLSKLPKKISKPKPKPKTIPPETICQSTPHPDYCKSILSNQTATDPRGYGRFSIRKSFSQSSKFNRLILQYIKKHPEIRALKDCRILSGFNVDFLVTSMQIVNNNTTAGTPDLHPMKASNVHTYLSAILTNLDTCLDSIEYDSEIKKDLAVPISDDSKLHSVSLALFTNAFVPKKNKKLLNCHVSSVQTQAPFVHNRCETEYHRKQLIANGRLNLKMSSGTRAIYDEGIKRRRFLETPGFDEQVLVSDIVVVSQDGSGNFTTVSDAVKAAPSNTNGTDGYFLVFIAAGVYEENVVVDRSKGYLMMVGDGINQTVITGNRSVGDGWTTFNSATFAVVAPNFVAANITFRNTAGPSKHQAVAVRNGADLSTFYTCSFEGYQDTLYTHSLRQFYRECDIYGTVDFIFGNAAVVLQNCNIYPRRPMDKQFIAITAQGRTDPNQNTGISIINCTIKPANDLVSNLNNVTVQTYLGRPWKKYSRTVYSLNFMDSLINPAGWARWDPTDFALATLYYGEFNNSGPGSGTINRVTWPGYHLIIDSAEAANFTAVNFLFADYWLPSTGVPYIGGFL